MDVNKLSFLCKAVGITKEGNKETLIKFLLEYKKKSKKEKKSNKNEDESESEDEDSPDNYTAVELKEICKDFSLSQTGNKEVLFNRIQDYTNSDDFKKKDKKKEEKDKKKEDKKEKESNKEEKKEYKKGDYSNLTVVDLKKLCKDKSISGYSKLKKDELVKVLEKSK